VLPGTNRAALEADIEILAHPGLITDDEVRLAKRRGIFLEITTRSGHSETNAHVAGAAINLGARLILNTDSHVPEDVISIDALKKFAIETGLSQKELMDIHKNTRAFLEKRGIK